VLALRKRLEKVDAGRVLDVAAGEGEFSALIAQACNSLEELVGIDVDEESLEVARDLFADHHPGVTARFLHASADQLPFDDESFDTVTMSNALHHVPDVERALGEIYRVLRPGGLCVVNEMVRDGLSEKQRNARDLHHLKSWIDRIHGVSHRETFTRRQILTLLRRLPLHNREVLVDSYRDEEPFSPEELEERSEFIEDYADHAIGHPAYPRIKKVARRLRHRIRSGGYAHPPQLVVLGWR